MSKNKKPQDNGTGIVIICLILFIFVMLIWNATDTKPWRRDRDKDSLYLMVTIMTSICGIMWAISLESSYLSKMGWWYLKEEPEKVEWVRIHKVAGNRTTGWAFGATAANQVTFAVKTTERDKPYKIDVGKDNEYMQGLLERSSNSIYQVDYTQIIAVNNQQMDSSASQAILGGLAFGAVGFMLGALSGSSQNGENEYTFLVITKDGGRDMVKVKQSSLEFKPLLDKMRIEQPKDE